MADKSDYINIINGLATATGPDRELDLAIGDAIGAADRDWAKWYTSSIDAALTLVPEGWCWQYYDGEMGVYRYVNPGNDRQFFGGEHNTSPAIALCIASLRARMETPKTPASP